MESPKLFLELVWHQRRRNPFRGPADLKGFFAV
jgi:hypothetical protein